MVGSIDPRCETIRGTHWPVKVAGLFGTRVAENHLGQRSTNRTNRPDIWMQAIRSDLENSCGTGAVHIWVPDRVRLRSLVRDDVELSLGAAIQFSNSRHAFTIPRREAPGLCVDGRPRKEEGAGKTGCALHPRSRVQYRAFKKRTRAYRFSGDTPAFPAQWFDGLFRARPGDQDVLVTVAGGCPPA